MKITISDPTLRDGNHAVRHGITVDQVKTYCTLADEAGVDIVEVGHGNGLGASSLQIGVAAAFDHDVLRAARAALKHAKLGVHDIPGFATIERDVASALDDGVDVVRVASHVTEADLCERHIRYVKSRGRTAFGVLMMSHMADEPTIIGEAHKLEDYGADAIIIMDSAGHSLPAAVFRRVEALVSNLHIPVGFHAHNNLGCAIPNTMAAMAAGATIVDGTACGFGAGAGNTQLEVLVAVMQRSQDSDTTNFEASVDLDKYLLAADYIRANVMETPPSISSISLISGLSGVFSGFAGPVKRAAEKYKVSALDIFRELGKRRVVAGQEDIITEVAEELARWRK